MNSFHQNGPQHRQKNFNDKFSWETIESSQPNEIAVGIELLAFNERFSSPPQTVAWISFPMETPRHDFECAIVFLPSWCSRVNCP
mmetsp:Transcript_577/g.1105  ORF Transcript_577/g.1105 Transcript_577/m.1105 type:complete len:85 (-) Transcript_577:4585-4839(-)